MPITNLDALLERLTLEERARFTESPGPPTEVAKLAQDGA